MDLVPAEPFELIGVERFAERLLADQGSVRQFLFSVLEPRQHFGLQEMA